MSLLVALDAGTGGAKCGVFDLQGQLRALRYEPWSYEVETHPELPMIRSYRFDTRKFWSILCRCARRALADTNRPPGDVIGVAATSQREGCVFLDAKGEELYAGPNLDSRGFQEGLEVLDALGAERLYDLTGHSAPFIFAIARYLWFRRNDGREVAHLLMINDWMTYRLSGRFCSEPSNAAESMLFDFRHRTWSADILDRFDVAPSILPAVLDAGTRVGEVTRAAARATGLRAGTPVFVGGADTQCSLLGAGVVEPGEVAAILGTTCPVQAVVAEPVMDPRRNLWAGCHVVPDRWVIEANGGGAGDGYQWLLDLLVPRGKERYRRAERLARDAPSGGTFTFIGPRIFDLTKIRPDLPGGIFFRFPAVQLRPGAGEIVRAYLESLGFAIRANLELLRDVLGASPERLHVGGGMVRNHLLLEILADTTGLPVRRAGEPESTGLGVAILAAVGAGAHSGIGAARAAMCRHEDVTPDAGRRDAYRSTFAKWRELYDALDRISI